MRPQNFSRGAGDQSCLTPPPDPHVEVVHEGIEKAPFSGAFRVAEEGLEPPTRGL